MHRPALHTPGRPRRRRAVYSLLLAASALVVSLVVAEIVARVVVPQRKWLQDYRGQAAVSADMLRPDPLIIGSARALGLTPFAQPDNPRFYTIQPTSLRVLVADFARRLNGRATRVVGDPDTVVRRIVVGPGSGVPVLSATPEPFDLSIGGETAEAGGNAEYILDAAAIGQRRAMILLGHMLSEDWGMQEVADWMRPLLPGVTVEWIGAGEPFTS